SIPEGADARLDHALAERKVPAPADAVEKALLAFLRSDEFLGDMPAEPADGKERVATALAKVRPPPPANAPPADRATWDSDVANAVAQALGPPTTAETARDLSSSITKSLAEIWRREQAAAWARALVKDLDFGLPRGAKGDRFVTAVGNALLDLGRDVA